MSKIRFVNLYRTVLIKKKKLTKKGRNHPFAKLDKVLKKNIKSKLLIGDKTGLVVIITIKQRLVVIIAAIRELPSLKMHINRPKNAHRGM